MNISQPNFFEFAKAISDESEPFFHKATFLYLKKIAEKMLIVLMKVATGTNFRQLFMVSPYPVSKIGQNKELIINILACKLGNRDVEERVFYNCSNISTCNS